MKQSQTQGNKTPGYVKIHWTNGEEKTAGLVFNEEELKSLSLGQLSRSWPMWEATKMKKLICSKTFPTWEEAFNS